MPTIKNHSMLNKAAAMLMSAVMFAGLFAGCTKDNTLPTSNSAPDNPNSSIVETAEDNGDRLAMGWLTKDLGSAKNPAGMPILSKESETVETKTGSFYTSFLVSPFTIEKDDLSAGLANNDKTKDWAMTSEYEEHAAPRLFSASPNETSIQATYSVTARNSQPDEAGSYVKIGFTTDSANVKGIMSVQADFDHPLEKGIDQDAMYEILKTYTGDKLANLLVYMRDIDKVDSNMSQLGEASCCEAVDGGNGVYVVERYVEYENGYDISAVRFRVHIEDPARNMAYDLSPADCESRGDDVRYDVSSMFGGRLGAARLYTYQDSMKEYFAIGTLPYEKTGVTRYEIREEQLADGTTDYFVAGEFVKGDASKQSSISVEKLTNEDENGVVRSYSYKIGGVIDVIPATGQDGEEDAAIASLIDTASKQLSLIFGEEVPLQKSYFSNAGENTIAADLTILFAFSGDTIPTATHIELTYDQEAEAWTGTFRIEGANAINHEN